MSYLSSLKKRFPRAIKKFEEELGHDVLHVEKNSIVDLCKYLKESQSSAFALLLDICGVDYIGQDPRFEVVYHLYSIKNKKRLRLRCAVSEKDLVIPSVIDVWPAADWFEREAYDMFGIQFKGHPKMKRLLMWEGFEGYPLRKDYPIEKRQPIPEQSDIV